MNRLLVALICTLLLGAPTWAFSRAVVHIDAYQMNITRVNQKRVDNSIVLYTPSYGTTTRTNPYGVEVVAVPVGPQQYQVTQVVSIWQCQAQGMVNQCGNVSIPEGGVVLSATGIKRQRLIKRFPVGEKFTIEPVLLFESRKPFHVINPTAQTNKKGRGFPGLRGGQQMIVYTQAFDQPTTGTNEFGFEVTIVDGMVVRQEGANSLIPKEPDSFVLSGHGRSRDWLIQYAPVGARVVLQGNTIISQVNRDTYLYQLNRYLNKIAQLRGGQLPQAVVEDVDTLHRQAMMVSDNTLAHDALTLKKNLKPLLWQSYPTVFGSGIRGVWHRPSETSTSAIAHTLDRLKAGGVNTIFLETYLHGDPIFPSETFKQYGIPQRYPFQLTDSQGDLLQIWLDQAHQRHMKVHVWFQTFYAGNQILGGRPGPILETYPHWANIQRSATHRSGLTPSTLERGAYFLDPVNEEVQTFLLALIDEIVTRYPIDGFQLDYIRYPSSFPTNRYSYVKSTWGYTPVARKRFQSKTGTDPMLLDPKQNPVLWTQWQLFKEAPIHAFVEKVHQRLAGKIPLSAAVFPDETQARVRKHQHWELWVKQGWLELIAPMNLTSSTQVIANNTQRLSQYGIPVITGVFGPFNGNNDEDVLEQVWAAAQSGAAGVVLFDTAHLNDRMVDALGAGLFQQQGR